MSIQHVDDQGQTLFYLQSDIIDKTHRCGTRTAVSAVDCYEVGSGLDTTTIDLVEHIVQPTVGADHRFESHRFATHVAQTIDHIEQIDSRVDIRVSIRADRRFAFRDATNGRYFCSDFCRRQYPTFARFRALA